ncbi:hypothetical protein B0T26DRAFT_737200 [Lasiosphaeria miniovina]|uniref:DUF6314 domain-containing protein n=1 Tax=Lasiosphaeria miniovina TaxID=1954250 RepID=A0AA40EEJ2_9PEZI|nr:uncharacterized protein B0T26DRAFT_737200 [Lasiosphaeria miniovina]KAK0734571.1 hypothetical protein B0T26DRAFT_737200 [Lasiosphaeria miniovina]
MPKTVCIVGAGPSGLVAAKSLLHGVPSGTFDVAIFDAQSRIGGLWPAQKNDSVGLLHPRMVANQSKHTVQFSDLAWGDADPELPRAWQVGRYLERYFQTYCRQAKLNLGCRVEKAELLPASDTGPAWRIHTRSRDGKTSELAFDFLLVASGFFGRPAIPSTLSAEQPAVPVIHSSQYRDLAGLLHGTGGKGDKILIVGGQMSGIEIAGTIASHLSSAIHSPGKSPIPSSGKYSIHHITQKPAWVFPLHTSPKPASLSPPFLPLDLGSYNLANRPEPLVNTQGHISVDAAKTVHSIYQTILGNDQSIFSPAVAVTAEDTSRPPYLAVSDHYMDFVRSGLISVSHGKLESLSDHNATLSPSGEQIGDIAAVILATGFEAASSISFLPLSIRETLSLSPSDLNNTLALAFHGTHHPAVPALGFVGFYRSPYWGVMEMQARLVTALWIAGGPASRSLPPALRAALDSDTSVARTLALRTDPRASQFPMGDYAWLMQEFAAALGLQRLPPPSNMPRLPPAHKAMDVLTPARYPAATLSDAQRAEVAASLRQTEATVRASLGPSARFVARAVFRSLLGEWKLERSLVSRLPSHPSGHFSGTARFLLREGTRDGRGDDAAIKEVDDDSDETGADADLGMEYLYIEEGDFTADNGLRFRASRRYVWRYSEPADALSVWFVRTDDPRRADYLFHQVQFAEPPLVDEGRGWCASAGHLCVDDFYDVAYDFNFQAVNMRDWRLAYTVRGPKKDYTIDGVYRR